MDPAKPARVETRLESQVRGWLQYGEELGLGPYYRDRSTGEQTMAASGATLSAVTDFAIASNSNLTVDTSEGLEEQDNPMPSRKILKESASALISPIHAETLFGEKRIADDTLPVIREFIGECTRCKLSKARTKIVFGVGSAKAQLMFVGEGPGRDEDLSGEPFVGRAGKLLTEMIKAMGLQREDVYIANIVKCRPPENRQPEHDEVAACSPFLMRQIDVIQPKVICTLGNTPTQTLMQTTRGISSFRGEWFEFRNAKLMPTYHPAYLLRNPAAKADVWKDLQKVMEVLGLPLPRKR